MNPPKVNASPGTIKKYMTQEGVKESPEKQLGTKSKQTEGALKNGHSRQSVGANSSTTVNEEQEEENEVELRTKSQLPTKGEMADTKKSGRNGGKS